MLSGLCFDFSEKFKTTIAKVPSDDRVVELWTFPIPPLTWPLICLSHC